MLLQCRGVASARRHRLRCEAASIGWFSRGRTSVGKTRRNLTLSPSLMTFAPCLACWLHYTRTDAGPERQTTCIIKRGSYENETRMVKVDDWCGGCIVGDECLCCELRLQRTELHLQLGGKQSSCLQRRARISVVASEFLHASARTGKPRCVLPRRLCQWVWWWS